jgi:hypothetical protein
LMLLAISFSVPPFSDTILPRHTKLTLYNRVKFGCAPCLTEK